MHSSAPTWMHATLFAGLLLSSLAWPEAMIEQEERHYIEDRLKAHSSLVTATGWDDAVHDGTFAMLVLRNLRRNMSSLETLGFDEGDATALERAIDAFDFERLEAAAITPGMEQLCSTLDASDAPITDVARIFAVQVEDVSRQAFAGTLKSLARALSNEGTAQLRQIAEQQIAGAGYTRIDYQGLARDLPRYTKRHFEFGCSQWSAARAEGRSPRPDTD